MSSVKITELSSSGPLTGTEVLPIVQDNETVKTTVQEIGSFNRPYKVYTALLTQSGGDVPSVFQNLDNGSLVVGVTYEISSYEAGDDFTNVGAPSNANGVQFVATGTTAASWSGATELNFNHGAPVVTVLENTIGNIWFTYNNFGSYQLYSDGLFTIGKTTAIIGSAMESILNGALSSIVDGGFNSIFNIATAVIIAGAASPIDDQLVNTPIEIRVYN